MLPNLVPPDPLNSDPLVAATAATDLVQRLRRRGETVATAESLTAGLLAATIAGVPGASAVLRGGLVVYATELKAALADVDEHLLATHGPVAAETASAMAIGAAHRCGADWGIALTGVAGPDPQDGHPPGTVYIGIARVAGQQAGETSANAAATLHHLTGGRWHIRLLSCTRAIDDLRVRLVGSPD